jgi:diguanylate cyclase (GGDEF)-like protein/PAS domain S-box-containing protein
MFSRGTTMTNKKASEVQKYALEQASITIDQLNALVNASDDMMAYIDTDLCYVKVNAAYADFHNKPIEFFTGIKVKDVVGKKNFPQIYTLIQRAFEGESFKINGTYSLENNQIRHEESIFKPVYDDHGMVIACIAVIKDISEEKERFLEIEASLYEQHELFKMVNNENPDIVLIRDYEGRFLFVNKALANLYATTPEKMLGKTDEAFNPNKDQRDFYLENIREIMDRFETVEVCETSTDVKTGEIRHYQSIKKPIRDKHGNLCILVIAHDITDVRNHELQLQQFAAVTKHSREGVMIVDPNENIVAINESFTTITGYSASDVIGKKPSILKSGEHDKSFYDNMWKSLETKDRWSGEIWNKNKNNTTYPEWLTISVIRDKNGAIINYVGIFSDLSEEKASEEKISYLALHDTLTGLNNRYQFENRLEHALLSRQHNNHMIALLFLDLDNFKDINDNYGHETGDRVLQTVAKQLRSLIRKEDTLARFGGDEFVILSEHLHESNDASSIAQNILNKFMQPITVEEQIFHLSFSIGIALYPSDGIDKSTLLKAADVAMYKAKANGKNCFSFYDASLTDSLKARLQIEYDLRVALEEQQFELFYQPQINLSEGKIIGLESLIRWNHPEKGLLYPETFIDIAEQTRMIIPLGEWILTTACTQAQQWYEEGIFDGMISINISALQLEYSELPRTILNALETSKLSPSQLEIEITESVIMKNPERWVKLFKGLKEKGVRFAIDDFGTGYSSLSYLRQLPLDVLKIDKSFIDDLPQSIDACTIADTIISLASRLGLHTIAEGVDTREKASYLINAGCTIVQGFLYDKPLDVASTRERLSNKRYNIWTGEKFKFSSI